MIISTKIVGVTAENNASGMNGVIVLTSDGSFMDDRYISTTRFLNIINKEVE